MSFNKVKTFIFICFLFSLACCLLNSAYADTVDMDLSRDKMALGETVTISFSLNSLSTRLHPDFSPLEKDFRIVGTNRNISINMINGDTHARTLWQVILEPKTAGELLIPEITFGSAKSVARKILVNEPAPSIQSDQQSAPVFVQAELNNTSPYVQSQVLYTFKLFYHTQLQNPTIEPPHVKDVALEPIGDDKYYETTIKGERFFVFEKTFALFPQKSGKLIIPPTHFHAMRFDNDLNLMNPFPLMTNEPITLSTRSFSLDVQKVPDNFQGKIWLPAKNIALTEKWSSDPNRWETGNPITRTITIQAQGLRADQIPDLSIGKISGVNIYADPPHRSNSLQDTVVIGTCHQKITYIPNQSQTFTIPTLRLKWWNTQTNTNAIAQLPAVNVQVQEKKNNTESIPTNIVPDVTVSSPKPAVDLSLTQPATANRTLPFYFSIWFWISICLLVIWLMTLWILWKKRTPQPENTNPSATENNHLNFHPKQVSEKTIVQACEQGDTLLVQKLILLWAKKQWQDPPHSLGKLREMINDNDFKKALADLEQALYANETIRWDGHALLAAYQHAQKHKMHSTLALNKDKMEAKHQTLDPLPPLNPN